MWRDDASGREAGRVHTVGESREQPVMPLMIAAI